MEWRLRVAREPTVGTVFLVKSMRDREPGKMETIINMSGIGDAAECLGTLGWDAS